MSNKPSELLFQLIKSLSPSEKGYFKKFTSFHILNDGNIYVRLFDALDTQKSYDEQALLQKGFKAKRLSGLKNYLYSLLLKSLDNYHVHQSMEDTIRKLLSYTEILYNKGLYIHCLKTLAKARRLASSGENYRLLLEVIRWERSLIILNRADLNRLNISKQKINGEEKNVLEKLDNLNAYRGLYNQVNDLIEKMGASRNKTDLEKLNKIVKDPLFKNANLAHSILAKSHFYNSLSRSYEILGDTKRKYEIDKQFVYFMESHKADLFFNTTNFIIALHNMLMTLIKLRNSSEFTFYLKKLKAVSSESEIISAQIFEFASINELDMCIHMGEFEQGISKVKEIEKGLIKYKASIHGEAQVYIYFNMSFLHFGSGKFRNALQWANKVLNEPDVEKFGYVHSYTKILILLIHFELENMDMLSYLIRSFRTTIGKNKKEEKSYRVTKAIFDFFEEKSKIAGNLNQWINDFKLLRKNLLSFAKHPIEKAILEETKIIPWLSSKIEQRPFADILNEK